MHNILRTAAIELQTLDSKEVVKVAGIVRRLKNWYKKQTNPIYKEKVLTLQQDTSQMQSTLTALHTELNSLQNSIKDGEIEEYNVRLNNVKDLAAKLWMEFKNTASDSKDYYTMQDMEVPGFAEWFKKHLPSNYDLDLGTIYNKPLKETKWYSNLSPDQISLREGGSLTHLFNEVKKTLVRDGFTSPEEADALLINKDAFIKEFQNAVVGGTLITAKVKKPSKDVDKMMAGATEIEVTTAPFIIPGSGIQMQAKVNLIDLGTTKSSRQKLSLRKTHYVTLLGNPKKASRQNLIKKIALQGNELPYQITQLSDIQFAEVLRQGYQKAFGADPTAEALAGGWAQAVLESGRPIKLPNNNVGNIKATPDWVSSGQPYFVKSTDEYSNDGKYFQDKNAKWKAYATPEDGAAGYWKLIGNHYKSAMDWMAAGDPTSATVALAMNRYFTANIEKYARGVSGLYGEFMNKVAPQLQGLKSSPTAAPGQKPEVKTWVDQYSKSEKDAVLGTKTAPGLDDVDNLINMLYADNSIGLMDKFVKQAILKEILPTSKLLVVLMAKNSSFQDKIEYARIAGRVLNKFADGIVSFHTNGDDVEIQCSILGTPLTTTKAAQALCDCVSDAMEMKRNKNIIAMVVPGFLSKYAEMEVKCLYRNQRISELKNLEK